MLIFNAECVHCGLSLITEVIIAHLESCTSSRQSIRVFLGCPGQHGTAGKGRRAVILERPSSWELMYICIFATGIYLL